MKYLLTMLALASLLIFSKNASASFTRYECRAESSSNFGEAVS